MHSESYGTWCVILSSVHLSVFYHISCHYVQQGSQKSDTNGFSTTLAWYFEWQFSAFKNYGVKLKQKAKIVVSTASLQPVFATLHTVEASEVTQRSGRES